MTYNRRAFLVVALAVLPLAATALPAAAQTASPMAPVTGLYTWYFQHAGDWQDHFASAKPFLDSELYGKVATLVTLQKNSRKEVIDFDFWNGTQVEALSYVAGTPSLHGSAYWIPVTIKLERPGTTQHFTVVVKRDSSGNYRVYDILYKTPSAFSLRNDVDGLLKENTK